jgi:hypothetical protein
MNAFTIRMERNDSKDEIIGLVQGVQNFVFRNSNRIRIRPLQTPLRQAADGL